MSVPSPPVSPSSHATSSVGTREMQSTKQNAQDLLFHAFLPDLFDLPRRGKENRRQQDLPPAPSLRCIRAHSCRRSAVFLYCSEYFPFSSLPSPIAKGKAKRYFFLLNLPLRRCTARRRRCSWLCSIQSTYRLPPCVPSLFPNIFRVPVPLNAPRISSITAEIAFVAGGRRCIIADLQYSAHIVIDLRGSDFNRHINPCTIYQHSCPVPRIRAIRMRRPHVAVFRIGSVCAHSAVQRDITKAAVHRAAGHDRCNRSPV